MTNSENVEYFTIDYVPAMLSDKRVSIAAVFMDSGNPENRFWTLCVAPDWRTRVVQLDPHADLGTMAALLRELRDRLRYPEKRSSTIYQLEDSFSNAIQISQRRRCPAAVSMSGVKGFARKLLGQTRRPTFTTQAPIRLGLDDEQYDALEPHR